MALTVWTEALTTAAEGWADQQEKLRSARTDLGAAEGRVSTLGTRVSGAMTTFLDAWMLELGAQRTAAERHSDALSTAATNYEVADATTAAELASLLSWDQRDLRPEP